MPSRLVFNALQVSNVDDTNSHLYTNTLKHYTKFFERGTRERGSAKRAQQVVHTVGGVLKGI